MKCIVKPIWNDRSSIVDFDSLNIMSVSLLGCPFVPKQGPWSWILDPGSKVLGHWSLFLSPGSMIHGHWSLVHAPCLFQGPWSLVQGPWSDRWSLMGRLCSAVVTLVQPGPVGRAVQFQNPESRTQNHHQPYQYHYYSHIGKLLINIDTISFSFQSRCGRSLCRLPVHPEGFIGRAWRSMAADEFVSSCASANECRLEVDPGGL